MPDVFLYGTLKHGGDTDYVEGTLYKCYEVGYEHYGLPGYRQEGTSVIEGKVDAKTQNELMSLDSYEGVPLMYKRVKVKTFSGRTVYLYEATEYMMTKVMGNFEKIPPDKDGIVRW